MICTSETCLHWVTKGHSKMQYSLIHKVSIYDIDSRSDNFSHDISSHNHKSKIMILSIKINMKPRSEFLCTITKVYKVKCGSLGLYEFNVMFLF